MPVKVSGSFFILWAVAAFCVAIVRSQKCVNGTNHLNTTQTHGESFRGICSGYKLKACCSHKTALSVDKHHNAELYGINISECAKPSSACDKYFKEEACFYECSPYIKPWEVDKPIPGAIRAIPVCASYCDAWYEACKDHRLCVPNLPEAYIGLPPDKIQCPGTATDNRTCNSFAHWYGNSKKMCETLWGTGYVYETSSNCFSFSVVDGDPSASACVTPPGSSTPVDPEGCTAYKQSRSSADRSLQVVQLAWLLSLVTVLAAWLGQN